jgi:hypothetical protein
MDKLKKWIALDGSKIRKAYTSGKKLKSRAVIGVSTNGVLNGSTSSLFGHIDEKNSATFGSDMDSTENVCGLMSAGWGVTDMFEVNSKLTGRTFDYDGEKIS